MDDKLFIPEKINVGYQNRNDTYTGKLAYVIYWDNKGKLRKERSWNTWRNNKIKPTEFANEPTEGFVLNKGVGGVKGSWSSWNTRNEYIRIYDPRDFEFEISVANLLFILQECSSIKGKGLEGEFVYSWQGTELVLLPVCSEEYNKSIIHTKRQDIKFNKDDLKEGYSYVLKNGDKVLYLGRYIYNNYNNYNYNTSRYEKFNPLGMKHIFYKLENANKDSFIPISGFTQIAEKTSSSELSEYPDVLERFLKSNYNGAVKRIELVKSDWPNQNNSGIRLIREGDKYYLANVCYYNYTSYYWRHNNKKGYEVTKNSQEFKLEVKNGRIKIPNMTNYKLLSKTSYSSKPKIDIYSAIITTEGGKKLGVF